MKLDSTHFYYNQLDDPLPFNKTHVYQFHTTPLLGYIIQCGKGSSSVYIFELFLNYY